MGERGRIYMGKFERALDPSSELTGMGPLDEHILFRAELDFEKDPPPSTVFARYAFFKAVRHHARHVLDDLASVLPIYNRLQLSYRKSGRRGRNYELDRMVWERKNRPSWLEIEYPGPFDVLAKYRTSLDRLVDRLTEWSGAHDLDQVWCRVVAYELLDFWARTPSACDSRDLPEPLPFPRLLPPREFVFRFSTHYPLLQNRTQAKKDLMGQFSRFLDRFIVERERDAISMGCKQSPQADLSSEHFVWLALYRCGLPRLSQPALAESVDAPWETVRDGIAAAAELCGFRTSSARPQK
jgi:hypothetical protein